MGGNGRSCGGSFRLGNINVLRRRGNVNCNAKAAGRQGSGEDGKGVVNVDLSFLIFRLR